MHTTTDHDDAPTGQVRAHLDAEAGALARDQALDAQPPATLCLAAIRSLLERSEADVTFTTDDIWVELGDAAETIPEPRSMGVAIRAARRAGWIAPTDGFTTSARPACHARPIRVWRRNIGQAF